MTNSIESAVQVLTEAVPDPNVGLPDAIFCYVSRTTPLINVDLLIKDGQGRTLLAWRCDPYAGSGWHIPGGIIRFKDTMAARIAQVANEEIGAPVFYDPNPIAIQEMIQERDVRGHFISLLFSCHLDASFVPDNKGRRVGDAGYLQWHQGCPADMVECQNVYRRFVDSPVPYRELFSPEDLDE